MKISYRCTSNDKLKQTIERLNKKQIKAQNNGAKDEADNKELQVSHKVSAFLAE